MHVRYVHSMIRLHRFAYTKLIISSTRAHHKHTHTIDNRDYVTSTHSNVYSHTYTATDLRPSDLVCHLSSLPVGNKDARLEVSGLWHRHTQTMLCRFSGPRMQPYQVRFTVHVLKVVCGSSTFKYSTATFPLKYFARIYRSHAGCLRYYMQDYFEGFFRFVVLFFLQENREADVWC